MTNIEITAKSTDKVTGKVTEVKGQCKRYDTLTEASKDMGGDGKVLAIVNMHIKIRALDALRSGTTPSLTKSYKAASASAQKKVMEILGMRA